MKCSGASASDAVQARRRHGESDRTDHEDALDTETIDRDADTARSRCRARTSPANSPRAAVAGAIANRLCTRVGVIRMTTTMPAVSIQVISIERITAPP